MFAFLPFLKNFLFGVVGLYYQPIIIRNRSLPTLNSKSLKIKFIPSCDYYFIITNDVIMNISLNILVFFWLFPNICINKLIHNNCYVQIVCILKVLTCITIYHPKIIYVYSPFSLSTDSCSQLPSQCHIHRHLHMYWVIIFHFWQLDRNIHINIYLLLKCLFLSLLVRLSICSFIEHK